jgi:hypothetical protein
MRPELTVYTIFQKDFIYDINYNKPSTSNLDTVYYRQSEIFFNDFGWNQEMPHINFDLGLSILRHMLYYK